MCGDLMRERLARLLLGGGLVAVLLNPALMCVPMLAILTPVIALNPRMGDGAASAVSLGGIVVGGAIYVTFLWWLGRRPTRG
jgi:hypothetical protein